MELTQKPLIPFGWLRAVLCFIFFLLFYSLLSAITGKLIPVPNNLLAAVLLVNFSMLVSAWLFRKFADRRSFVSLGFQWGGRLALWGVLTAFGVIAAGTLVLLICGWLKFGGVAFAPGSFLYNVLLFGIVALGEELFFRGYMLNNLLQSFKPWLALGISALFFMSVHLQNPGATTTVLPVLMAITGGVLFGLNYIYTKNLWFGIALHFTWNFLQGPVFGFNVSGASSTSVFSSATNGPSLLTGGTFGYEGSVLCIALSILAIVVLNSVFKRKGS
jgi:hypothetical protein